jgi:hypothetical protein
VGPLTYQYTQDLISVAKVMYTNCIPDLHIWLSLLGFMVCGTHWTDSAVRVTVFRDLASESIHLNTMLYRFTEVDWLSSLSYPLNPLRLTILGYTVDTLNEGHISIL